MLKDPWHFSLPSILRIGSPGDCRGGVAWIAGLAVVDTGAEESEFLTFLTAATVCYLKHPALEEPVTHTHPGSGLGESKRV